MKILVTGATGLLGSSLMKRAAAQQSIWGIARHTQGISSPGTLQAVDLLDRQKLESTIESIQPDLVIHTAAMTSVDQCEKDPEQAWSQNVTATEQLLRAIRGQACRFIFISTDSVFDGRKGDYTEKDAVSPIHQYGRTKAAAEEKVLAARSDALVIRTAFYGWNLLSHKKSLAEQILLSLHEKGCFYGFTDVFFSPILTDHLAQLIFELAARPEAGIDHLASSEGCSKWEFARRLAMMFELPAQWVSAIQQQEVPLASPRPKNVTLSVQKVTTLLGRPMPSVQEGLAEFRRTQPGEAGSKVFAGMGSLS